MMNILFLPGLLCDGRLWRDQVAALAGMARSTVADLTVDNEIAAMAARALAAAPDRFALVALSMGGYVAFEIMRQAPERVTRLALISTSAAPDSPERQAQRRAGIEALRHGRFLGVTDRLLPQLVHPSQLAGPVAQDVKAMAARVGANAYLRQQEAILGRRESVSTLPLIGVPTLVAVGDEDRLTPVSEALQIHNGISGSDFHRLPACGHLPPMEQPELMTRLLHGFLFGDTPRRGDPDRQGRDPGGTAVAA